MGNQHSTASKSGTPVSTSPSASAGTESPRSASRKDAARAIIPPHTTQRSVAPPEPSLAQAQGSTVVNRPKSLPSTAVSSLSGSPHSVHSATATAAKPIAAGAAAAAAASSSSATGTASTTEHVNIRDEPTKPVDVPIESSSVRSQHSAHASHVADSYLVSNNSITDMYLTHPPRLPLPIEEEVHTPGSPILPAQDDLADLDLGESSDGMTRKSSALSATTMDDEDAEELRVDKTRPVVPTRLEWKRGGDKVYVTGTIFQWNRKQRLHPVEGHPGCFAATIHVLPGTHHVRFLVDGIMQTSPDLPTTVDFGNNFVNYIEVSPDDIPQSKQQKATPPKHEAAAAQPHAPAAVPAAVQAAAATSSEPATTAGQVSRSSSQKQQEAPRTPRGKAVLPKESYTLQVPQYLLDFDEPEESAAYQNAVGAIEKLPTPPSLPGFLAKPILNAATLMKDDNSVLNMPNHTVLNHLATCSIKNNTLAVSATTRYRNKYVTTIMYKPATTGD